MLEFGEQLGGDALAGGQQAPEGRVDAGVARADPESGAQAVRSRDLDLRRALETAPHERADVGQPLRIDYDLQAIEMTQAAARRRAGSVAPALACGRVQPARLQSGRQGLPGAIEK